MMTTGSRADPLPAFQFQVRFDGVVLGGFAEVTGLAAEVEVLDVVEGGQNDFVHRLPGRTRHTNITLSRGLATTQLWEWFAALAGGAIDRRTTVVELHEPRSEAPAMRWVLASAFPCKWNGPELKADQSLVAIESIELCHHGFSLRAEGA